MPSSARLPGSDTPLETADFESLIDQVQLIRSDMLRIVDDSADLLKDVHPERRASAVNLLHYLALRSRDMRPLQWRLADAGLSSLGRAESNALTAVESVLALLRRAVSAGDTSSDTPAAELTREDAQRILDAQTRAVLGDPPARGAAIMVTMPTEAADDYSIISDLVRQGMNCMRVNCAHDDPDQWERMIQHLRRAEEAHGRSCRVLMDLAGPKVRTGPIEAGPGVVKVRPRRNRRGEVVEPARVWLFAEDKPKPPPARTDASLPVPGDWIDRLGPNDIIRFTDTRGRSRELHVVATCADGCWLEAHKTCYIEAGTRFQVTAKGDDKSSLGDDRHSIEAVVGTLAGEEVPIPLLAGDEIVVTTVDTPGRAAKRDERGQVLVPATIGCTEHQIFEDVRSGDAIFFDDGKLGGTVERCESGRLHVRITRTRARGGKLASEKGINLPDTNLRLPALTEKDRADLDFVCAHADMVALSFVNSVDDVCALRGLLDQHRDRQPAIVLKIETRRGFDALPSMLLETMKSPRCAVMIARGDLAVECGFERMAEVQEEILCLCEAAHVPVIWATQVLESLAKDGLPSRAEVSDAAMSQRAECVMLNKGPFIVQAVKALDDILSRMEGHQEKKRAMLRELHLVSRFRKSRSL